MITAPPGDLCAGKPCWSAKPHRLQVQRQGAHTPEGLSGIDLKAGIAGKATLQAKSKGANLAMPTLPLVPPVTVRLLRKDAPLCWDSAPTRNDAAQFKAKSA